MLPKMESPALAARGVPATDLVDASIGPESKSPTLILQASRLTRRYAISFGMALIVAPLHYGDQP